VNNATRELVRFALIDERLGYALTKEQRLLTLLSDGRWHSGRELALRVSHRFGGYLHTLKEKGVVWEKMRDTTAPAGEVWYNYRLVDDDKQRELF
jgi:hypothetical protein